MTDCLFCRIIAGDLPADIVAQGERWLAFRDINPAAPVHILIVPREHTANAAQTAAQDVALAGELIAAAGKIAESEGIDSGYRLVFNTGAEAGQSVFHTHLHLLGGRPMTWPPG